MLDTRGKKVVFLGDSITAGACASSEEKKYVNVFAQLSGAEVFAYGICGTRIAEQITPSNEIKFDAYFASRIDDMVADADLVFVFGGTNDFGHGDAPLGVLCDTTPKTFYGAVFDLFTKLREKYPKAELYMLTPLHRTSELDTVNEWGLPVKKTFKQIITAEKEVANLLGVKIIDLYNESDLVPSKDNNLEGYFVQDGLHPNDAGHKRLAEIIYNKII